MILGAHGLAAICATAVLPLVAGPLVGLLLLALGAATARDRALLHGRRALRAIEITGPAQLRLELAGGERLEVPAGPRKTVNRLFVAVPVKASMRRTILVSADMLDAASYRALRLWALWGRAPGVVAQQPPA